MHRSGRKIADDERARIEGPSKKFAISLAGRPAWLDGAGQDFAIGLNHAEIGIAGVASQNLAKQFLGTSPITEAHRAGFCDGQ